MRRDYEFKGLHHGDLLPEPMAQFQAWFDQASQSCPADWFEVNAMTLATRSADGQPTSRIVLINGLDSQGPVFYTNYQSRKGQELAVEPRACGNIYWPWLARQVRIEGRVEKVAPDVSTAYYQSRPRGSQIGAHASPQSQVIPDRQVLEQRVKQLETEFAGQERLPRPDSWGGYRLVPHAVEFWQGQPSRLHDRLRYRRDGERWLIERLAP